MAGDTCIGRRMMVLFSYWHVVTDIAGCFRQPEEVVCEKLGRALRDPTNVRYLNIGRDWETMLNRPGIAGGRLV